MAKTKTELFTLIGANFPDNVTGEITPAKLREVTTQIADSMTYAALGVQEVEVLRATASVDQIPATLGTALQLTFGAAQKTPSDPVMLNSSGVITFNTAGNYSVRIKLQCGRTGAAGIATLLARLLLNGVSYGPTAAVRLDNSNSIIPLESQVMIPATAGMPLAVQIVRDSSSSSINAGGLYAVTPATPGWAVAPSALIVVSRLEPVP